MGRRRSRLGPILPYLYAPPDEKITRKSFPPRRVPLRLGTHHAALYSVLPSTGLLSESRFMSLTQSSLKPVGWLNHITTLAYGLDYALVCLLLAMWSFHYRSLRRD